MSTAVLALLVGCQSAARSGGGAAMIVATTPQSLPVGAAILERGGSAADAAIATAMHQIVRAGGSYVSFAGICSMMYYEASSGKVYYLNAGFNTPLHEDDSLFKPSRISGRNVLVPGFIAGAEAAHQRFGKLPFAEICQPAIDAAENGFAVDPPLAMFFQLRTDVLPRLPEGWEIFIKPDGSFYKEGEIFRQPQLAATLGHISRKGSAYIYRGAWAEKFVQIVQREGGRITMEDLAAYKPTWQAPLHGTFRKYDIYAPGDCSRGGVNVLEAFNLLELADLRSLGHYTKSPQSFFWLSQILGARDSGWLPVDVAKNYNNVDVTFTSRVKKETSQKIWALMQAGLWPTSQKMIAAPASSHTDGIVVVDRWGNVAAMTHTINTMLWGETGIFVDGISIPDSASFQRAQIKEAGPGRRLRDTIIPILVMLDGKPFIASSALGSGLHERTVAVLLNMLEFGMDPQSAHDAPYLLPRRWKQGLLGKGRPMAQVTEDSFDAGFLDQVRALGQEVKVFKNDDQELARLLGYWVGLKIDARGGVIGAPASNVAVPNHPTISGRQAGNPSSDKT